jgi:hypothetical protein
MGIKRLRHRQNSLVLGLPPLLPVVLGVELHAVRKENCYDAIQLEFTHTFIRITQE